MAVELANPFEITKAVDFTDEEIGEFWIDRPNASAKDFFRPNSSMPMYVLGGKGSGKTHLMRYMSFESQRIRFNDVGFEVGLKKDKYVGLYMRCGGLNAARFGGQGAEEAKWSVLYSYYMDLWLAQITVRAVLEICGRISGFSEQEHGVYEEVCGLLSIETIEAPPKPLQLLLDVLVIEQRKVDLVVNNYPFSRNLDFSVPVAPGQLVHQVPSIVQQRIQPLANVRFSYFIDEFENLSEFHQKYVNTLLREKGNACSFKIGSRLYGVKTHETYCAGEVNRSGSEFDEIVLEDVSRESELDYTKFCLSLCRQRLVKSGYHGGTFNSDADASVAAFDNYLQLPPGKGSTGLSRDELRERSRLSSVETEADAPYFEDLRRKMSAVGPAWSDRAGRRVSSADTVIDMLRFSDDIILERLNVMLFYKAWAAGKDLFEAASEIEENCEACAKARRNETPFNSKYKTALGHYKMDIVAQLRREYRLSQQYVGFEVFIKMSTKVPRNFLIVLKHVFQWSSYNGENPFSKNGRISIHSQQRGVDDASDWFFDNTRISGEDNRKVRASVSRLGDLLQKVRFSDKPAECSLCQVSIDMEKVSVETNRLVELAEKLSLIVRGKSGRKDRNERRSIAIFQINPMLAPIWNLPIRKRGDLSLSAEEANSIFDDTYVYKFGELSDRRVSSMMAPAFGRGQSRYNSGQKSLFEDV